MTLSPSALTPGTYPDIPPSTRDFAPPQSSLFRSYTISSRASRLLMSSKPGNGVLSLSYVDINHNEANLFLESYDSCYGSLRTFLLPSAVYLSISTVLAHYILDPSSSLLWKWQSPPVYESVSDKQCTVSTKLLAVLQG